MIDKKLLGDLGEDMAARVLFSQGYSILETKYKCKLGEVDIIAKKNNELSFVEVKTRTNVIMGTPAEAVNISKQNKIRNVANYYLTIGDIHNINVDFQVIEILFNQINYAF